jgi:hypothetical protein
MKWLTASDPCSLHDLKTPACFENKVEQSLIEKVMRNIEQAWSVNKMTESYQLTAQ